MGGSSNKKMEDPARGRSNMSQGPLDPATTALVRLAAAVAEGDVSELQERLAAAQGAGVPPLWIDELLLQSMLVVGYPLTLVAFGVWREVAGPTAKGGHAAEPLAHEEWQAWADRGAAVCRAVYGRAYHKLLLNLRALHPALEDAARAGSGAACGRRARTPRGTPPHPDPPTPATPRAPAAPPRARPWPWVRRPRARRRRPPASAGSPPRACSGVAARRSTGAAHPLLERRRGAPGARTRRLRRRPRPAAPAPSWRGRAVPGSYYSSPARSLPSFCCSSPPFTRSSPTGSPRVLTRGRAVSDAGRGRNPSCSSTAASASADATACPSATLMATPNPSRGSSAQ